MLKCPKCNEGNLFLYDTDGSGRDIIILNCVCPSCREYFDSMIKCDNLELEEIKDGKEG